MPFAPDTNEDSALPSTIAIARAIKLLRISVRQIEPVRDSHNSIVRVLTLRGGSRVVLKIPQSDLKLMKERRALEALDSSPFIPKLMDCIAGEDGTRGLLMSWLPGLQVSAADCQYHHSRQIGQALASIHATSHPDNAASTAAEWWRDLNAYVRTHLRYCRQLGEHSDWRRAESLLRAASEIPKCPVELGFTHFDFRLGNIHFNEGRLSGVLDFESTRCGAISLDFAKLADELWSRDPSHRVAMFEGYTDIRSLPVDLGELLPLYRLYQSLTSVAWCVKHGRLGNDPFFLSSRSAVTQHLDL